VEPLSEKIAALAALGYLAASSFAERYRLLEALAATSHPSALEALLQAAKDGDHALREIAVGGLRSQKDRSAVGPAVREALADDSPKVRLAALDVIAKMGIEEETLEALQRLAKSDPWPVVRTTVARLAGGLPKEAALPILETAAADEAVAVRLEATKSIAGIPGARAGTLLEERLSKTDEDLGIVAVAARALGARCQASSVPVLHAVLVRGAKPLASQEEITAAIAAASSMGAIGDARSRRLLEQARKRSNPATDRAIDAALENASRRCGDAEPKAPPPEGR
jgi:HEAT repeat protein